MAELANVAFRGSRCVLPIEGISEVGVGRFATTKEDRGEFELSNDFTSDQEVLFSIFASAVTLICCPFCQSIDGGLQCLVHSEAVNVQHCDLHAAEMHHFLQDIMLPESETILHTREL